ncbi:trypsin-like serine peptidase [Paractinoplanes atraurantiacus]|uniref:Endonuclease G n=1 Tax=Paractinoplanes atraurantiacus TaxID=1036182 RepID=A0A285IAY8_9ACTN|nr:serine protease [Actinoplanes atraurantiacus]SNY45142.1 endonuclease G [Actinoplanes atraurantiacus]
MDYRFLLADRGTREEFLARYDELAATFAAGRGGPEALEGGVSFGDPAEAVKVVTEGVDAPLDPGMEAIIERFTRPVQLVQHGSFRPPADGFPQAELVIGELEQARAPLESAIPSSGRVDLRNHRKTWAGTGWVVGDRLVVTNRHVAEEFARPDGAGFVFREPVRGRRAQATMDWRQEHDITAESRFRVERVLWIEPEPSHDVALLRVTETGEDGEPCPPPIGLLSADELDGLGVGGWIGVIGYPARDSRNDLGDQQRLFDGIFDVKRLAPGRITGLHPAMVRHDATTLGGNSGSALVDFRTGKAAALHFGGIQGDANCAVPAPALARIIAERAS